MSLLLSAIVLSLNYSIFSNTVDTVCGTYTGHTIWDADTIKLTCDVKCDTLTILPGTIIEFQGHYQLKVKSLQAIGTANDSIIFTINDTTGFHDFSSTDGGWNGISGEMSIYMEYCKIKYCKTETEYVISVLECTIKIKNSDLIYNYAENGTVILSAHGNTNIKRSNISNNYCCGIKCCYSIMEIDSCIITNNDGDGIRQNRSVVSITNSIICNNNGRGISAFEARGLTISGNVITYNKCGINIESFYNPENGSIFSNKIVYNNPEGGIRIQQHNYPIINNIIADNSSSSTGGGIYLEISHSKLINNTIINNSAQLGGGIYFNICKAEIFNSIIRGNVASQYGNQVCFNTMAGAEYKTSIFYSNIEGGKKPIKEITYLDKYENNIDVLPYFLDPENGDYSLADSSHCINTGTPDTTGLNLPEFDLAGNPRIYPGSVQRIDIGAYEFQGEPVNHPPYLEKTGDQEMFVSTSKDIAISYSETDPNDSVSVNISCSLPNICIDNVTIDSSQISFKIIPEKRWTGKGDIFIVLSDKAGHIVSDTFAVKITKEICGEIAGNMIWDADTIKVTCDVKYDTLTIMPGVVVEFQGYYSILADSIYAVGTKTDSILFTINDTTGLHDLSTTDGGWAFVESGFFGGCDEIIKHKFEYCIFEYGKQVFDHEYQHSCHGGTVLVERCTYRYNYIKDHLIYYGAKNCKFIGNNCGSISGARESYFLFDSCTIKYNTLNSCLPEHSSSVNIENCNIHHNKGCGIGADHVTIENTLIHHNEVRIGARNYISVSNSIINHNKGDPVIFTGEGYLIVVNSLIHDNEGTAIHASSDNYIDIINNQIFNNKGDGINLGYEGKRLSTVTNNLIYNNNGSGISLYYSEVIISNNTIVNNKAEVGGGIKIGPSKVQMYNNIVRNNGINNIGFVVPNSGMSYLSIQNCNIEGLNDLEGSNLFNNNGINNSIDFDPYFIDTSSFDFRLSDSSICINAGIINPAEFNISEFDLDGNPRIYDGSDKRIDIGAYEFQGEPRGRAPLLTPTSDQYLLKSSIEKLQVWYIGYDPDELHTLSITSSDTNVIISELSGNNPGSTYLLIPEEEWEGKSTVIVKIEDGQGYFDIDTFMVYVGNVQCGIINNNRVWNLDTIIVVCDVLVDENAQLAINPGTVVLFEDYTALEIFGKIEAIGTTSDRILFTAKDTSGFYNNTFAGWKGIKFKKYGKSSSSRLSDCIVEYCNSTPGAVSIEDEYIVISKSIVRNNNLKGSNTGAVSITGANNILDGNIIYNNCARTGGGVYLGNTNVVINNFITNNISTGYAAGICNIGNSLIANNIISNNSCTGHGSGGFYSGTSILLNNTITNNYSNNNGGGLYLKGKSVLKNCIIWNNQSKNSGNQIFMENNYFSEFSIEYCLIRNGDNDIVSDDDFSLSVTNKVTDPMFIAPSSGVGVYYSGLEADWSLSSKSPCINSGTIDTTGLNLPPYDIGGYPRVFHGRIDIGAYEFISDTIAIVEQPENIITCYGDSVSLKIDGIDLFAIQWQKNETNIPDANKKELKINPVTLEDEGEYKCIVSNIVDTLFSQKATITVHEGPQIISNEVDIDVCEYEDTVILVQADGSLPFTYQWYKNNAIFNGYIDSVLVLSSVTNDDEAVYKYVIVNHCGSDSANFQVNVSQLPAVDLGEDILLNEGYSTVLDAGEWSSYLWNDNSSERFLEVSQQGTYWSEVMDENGCKNRDTINVTIDPVENLNDAYSEAQILLYPVPFREKIFISLPETEKIYTIKIIDITGTVIRIMNPILKTPVELHRGNLIPGVYLLELTTDKGIWMRKVIVE